MTDVLMTRLHTDLLPALGLGKENLMVALARLAEITLDEWGEIASRELKSSREAYLKALTAIPMEVGAGVVTIFLARYPKLADSVEHGLARFDMRDTMLKPGQRGVKTSKSGYRFRSVPFRHLTPGGESSGFARTMGAEDPSGKIGLGIHKRAKGLRLHGGTAQTGNTRLSERQTWNAGAVKLKAHHVTNPYVGMIKKGAAKGSGGGHTFWTFRTISTNPASSPLSWMHPGIRAHNIAQKAAKYAALVWPGILRNAVSNTEGA